MRAPIPTGGSAFPVTDNSRERGMTLRDWLAGMALQGSISGDPKGNFDTFSHAMYSYELADQMILIRDEGGGS
jgi:hypothetical protein